MGAASGFRRVSWERRRGALREPSTDGTERSGRSVMWILTWIVILGVAVAVWIYKHR